MLPKTASIGPTYNSTTTCCLSQTPLVAGNLNLNGTQATNGVVQLNTAASPGPDRVVFFPAGAEATNGTTWTITGTDWNGNVATEVVNGVNNPATAVSVYDYNTVTQIAVNKAQSGAVTVGTNGSGSSRPIFLDTFAPSTVSIQVDVTGTANATVQQSLDDPNTISGGYTSMTWINHPDPNLNGITASVQGNYAYLPKCVRLLQNSGSGSLTITVIQADA